MKFSGNFTKQFYEKFLFLQFCHLFWKTKNTINHKYCCSTSTVVSPLSFSKQTSENFRQSKKSGKISRIETDKFSSRMAPLRFNIPLQRKDLLRGASDGQYWVENEYSIRELKTKLVVSFFKF